jgi:hypothetical protein
MKRLLAVGDSFTYGDELPSQALAWPQLLGDRLGYVVDNRGQSGSSNPSIVRRTLNYLAQDPADLVIIGWASPGRIEWRDAVGDEWDLWPGCQLPGFLSDFPWRRELVNYVNQYHSAEYLFELYLIHVISLQSYCQANNIPCVMINTRCNDYYHQAGMCEPRMGTLRARVNLHWFVEQGRTSMTTLAAATAQGPAGHFLEQGHQLVAAAMYQHIIESGLVR